MKPNIAIISSSETVTVYIDGDQHCVRADASNYKAVMSAIRAGDYNKLKSVLNVKKVITNLSAGSIVIKGEKVYFEDLELRNPVVDRILTFVREGQPFEYMLLFLERLLQNPSRRSIQELFDFMERNYLPITTDGYILGYKGVQSNYYSVTRGDEIPIKGKVKNGHIYNGIGEEVEMKRSDVDDDFRNQCSNGLHVGAAEYASIFGDKTVIVKVDPASVVSVPADCSFQKMRVCHYWVIGDYKQKLESSVYNDKAEVVEPEGEKRSCEKTGLPKAGLFDELENLASNLKSKNTLPIREAKIYPFLQERITNYIDKRDEKGFDFIRLSQITNSLSPHYVSIKDLKEFLIDLGYTVSETGVEVAPF